MERPTKEQVDKMLDEYVHQDCECRHHTPKLDAHELADEVRALRGELNCVIDAIGIGADVEAGRDSVEAAMAVNHSLAVASDTIARVEAVRQHFYCEVGASDTFTAFQVNAMLEAALRGEG